MLGGKTALTVFLVLFLSATAAALSLQSFDVEFVVAGESAVASYTLVADENGTLELRLPAGHSGLSVFLDGETAFFQYHAGDRKVSLPVSPGERVEVSFVSEGSIEVGSSQHFFVYNFDPGFDFSQVKAKLLLPEGALLASAAEEGSVLPAPESISSDGRQLEIGWIFEGQETIFVSFLPQAQQVDLIWLLIPGLVVLIVLAGVLFWFLKVKAKPAPAPPSPPAKEEKKEEKKEELDLRGLTPEEKSVVLELDKNPEKQLSQSRLKDLTGFQKVKLSRIIARLEKREVVGKRPYGNTNLVFLKKKD